MRNQFLKYLITMTLAAVWAGTAQAQDMRWQGFVEGQYRFLGLPEGGLVEELLTERGLRVSAGDHLLSLESGQQEASLAGATAALERARAQYENLLKGQRASEIKATQERLAQALAERDLAEINLERQQELVKNAVASVETLDGARASFARSAAKVRQIEAELETAGLAARSDEISAAEAAIRVAESAVQEATWRLDQRRTYAPADGLIFDVYYRPGEYLAAGKPAISFLADGDRKVRFFVPQTVLSLIVIGSEVVVSCQNCGDGLRAAISFISPEAEFSPPNIFSETANDKLVFLVEAIPNSALAELAPGLPVGVSLP